jgi:hypothetical protein
VELKLPALHVGGQRRERFALRTQPSVGCRAAAGFALKQRTYRTYGIERLLVTLAGNCVLNNGRISLTS